MVSLSVRGGREAGSTAGAAGGGAAWVGNNCAMEAVAVGEARGVGDGNPVKVGGIAVSVEIESPTNNKGEVGVTSEGWNGVGVGLAFGAAVIRMKGCAGGGSVAGGAHEMRSTARQAATSLVVFINGGLQLRSCCRFREWGQRGGLGWDG